MRPVSFLVLALLLAGCDDFQKKPQSTPDSTSRFVIYSSAGETFLVNSETGKVWRYEPKEKVFFEIPVTSKIIRYDSHGNRVEPDPKDPLGLFEKPNPK